MRDLKRPFHLLLFTILCVAASLVQMMHMWSNVFLKCASVNNQKRWLEWRMSWTQFAFQNLPSTKKTTSHLHHLPPIYWPIPRSSQWVPVLGSNSHGSLPQRSPSFFAATHFFQHKNSDADILQLTMCMAWESKKKISHSFASKSLKSIAGFI